MASRVGASHVLLGLLAIAIAGPQDIAAAQAPDAAQATPGAERVIGAETRVTASGLYAATSPDGERIRLPGGQPLLTHGPDPPPQQAAAPADRAATSEVGFAAGSPQRAPICADTNSQQVLYAHQAGTENRFEAMKPRILAAMRRTDAVLNQESLDSGGPQADYRVRCDAAGEIDVGSVTTTGTSMVEIVNSARASGYSSEANDYIVFFEGTSGSACGVASLQPDERLAADNANNGGGDYAIVYQGCWYGDTPMHEMAHTMGAVQYGSPHSSGGGHCYDENDVLCYQDGGPLHPGEPVVACDSLERPRFDCGHDDYFDSSPAPGSYLAGNWNLGSSLNAFITFGAGDRDLYGEVAVEEEWHTMPVRVPRDAGDLSVSVYGPGDLTLYVRRAQAPTEDRFACRAQTTSGIERCQLRNPRRGRWIVGVLERKIKRPGPIRVRARLDRDDGAKQARPLRKSRLWRPQD